MEELHEMLNLVDFPPTCKSVDSTNNDKWHRIYCVNTPKWSTNIYEENNLKRGPHTSTARLKQSFLNVNVEQ